MTDNPVDRADRANAVADEVEQLVNNPGEHIGFMTPNERAGYVSGVMEAAAIVRASAWQTPTPAEQTPTGDAE